MDVIYVLRLRNDKWYVGRTSSVERRYEQHLKGEGSKWTFLHQPLNIHETREMKSDDDEDLVTLEYMKNFGIYNVRGGRFCAVELKPWNVREIKEKLEGNEKETARKLKEEEEEKRRKEKEEERKRKEAARKLKEEEEEKEAEKRREETARKLKEAADKVKNEFFNPDSDLRSGRWFKRTFGF
jgi:predicted GIY-YIG superfamily endonuclease